MQQPILVAVVNSDGDKAPEGPTVTAAPAVMVGGVEAKIVEE